MRRIEAVTGAAGADLFRERTERCASWRGGCGRRSANWCAPARGPSEQVRELRGSPPLGADDGAEADELVAQAEDVGGAKAVAARAEAADPKALLGLSDTVRQKLGEAAVVLGMVADGRGAGGQLRRQRLLSAGARAGELVRAAAEVAGGGGGGRDTMAQAGGAIRRSCPTRWRRRARRSSAGRSG